MAIIDFPFNWKGLASCLGVFFYLDYVLIIK